MKRTFKTEMVQKFNQYQQNEYPQLTFKNGHDIICRKSRSFFGTGIKNIHGKEKLTYIFLKGYKK
jgi:hypothetical protein